VRYCQKAEPGGGSGADLTAFPDLRLLFILCLRLKLVMILVKDAASDIHRLCEFRGVI